MNVFQTMYSRLFQGILYVMSRIIVFRIPETTERLEDIPRLLSKNRVKRPILVVSNTVSKSERFQVFKKLLKKNDIEFALYTGVSPDPTIKAIDVLTGFYKSHECDSVIAIGGGSVIDAAKATAVLATYPKKKISNFKGALKIHRKLPYFIAVPTTAGTGSEATIAAVVVDEDNNDKFSITDGHLVPKVAVLDDSLLIGIPKNIISTTGIDAFCHALESYLGRNKNKLSYEKSLASMKLIKENLVEFYNDSNNSTARANMQTASFYAGIALTRGYVGYVHALAHSIGGLYHKPHGYCVAILLPYVLEAYERKVYKKLAKLAVYLGLVDNNKSTRDKSQALIDYIKKTNHDLGIPKGFDGLIQDSDMEFLASHASKEANPWYPVPKELDKEELKDILILANLNGKR